VDNFVEKMRETPYRLCTGSVENFGDRQRFLTGSNF
jgi:hypothetical protein